jgi:hypothetical protein
VVVDWSLIISGVGLPLGAATVIFAYRLERRVDRLMDLAWAVLMSGDARAVAAVAAPTREERNHARARVISVLGFLVMLGSWTIIDHHFNRVDVPPPLARTEAGADHARLLQSQIRNLTQFTKDAARMGVLQVCLAQLKPLRDRLENDHATALTTATESPAAGDDEQWSRDLQDIVNVAKECYPNEKINLYAGFPENQMDTPTPDEPHFSTYDITRKYRYFWYQWQRARGTVFSLQARITQDLDQLSQLLGGWSRD